MKIKSLNNKILLFVEKVNSHKQYVDTKTSSGTILIRSLTIVEVHDLVMDIIFTDFSAKVNRTGAFKKYVGNFYKKKDDYGFELGMTKMKKYISFITDELWDGEKVVLSKNEAKYFIRLSEARNTISHSNFLKTGMVAGFASFQEVLKNLYIFLDMIFKKINIDLELPVIPQEDMNWNVI